MAVDQKYLDEIFETHLPYEIDMLRWAYERLEEKIEDEALCNSIIECFCVHARNLIEFLEKTGAVSAKAFANASYSAFSGKTRDVVSARQRLNNQISHLVMQQRTTETSDKIDADLRLEYLNMIESELAHFAQNLKPPRKPSWRAAVQVVRVTPGPPSATNHIQQSSHKTQTTTAEGQTVFITSTTPNTENPS